MTTSQFPTLALAIAGMEPRYRKATAVAISESTENPALLALAIELMRANQREEYDLAQHDADFHLNQAEQAGAEWLARIDHLLAIGPNNATAEDVAELFQAGDAALAADSEHQAAEGRVIKLQNRSQNMAGPNDAA